MVVLDKCTVIVDEKRFIEAHTATIERIKENKYFNPYLERLNKYREWLQANNVSTNGATR